MFRWLMCLPPLYPLLYLLNLFLCLFNSYYIDNSLLQSLCMLYPKLWPCIVFYCLNACDDSPIRQLSFTDHPHAYNRILKMGIIWFKITSPLLTKKNDLFWKTSSSLESTYFITCRKLCKISEVNWLKKSPPPTQVHHELTCCHNYTGDDREESDQDKDLGGVYSKGKSLRYRG